MRPCARKAKSTGARSSGASCCVCALLQKKRKTQRIQNAIGKPILDVIFWNDLLQYSYPQPVGRADVGGGANIPPFSFSPFSSATLRSFIVSFFSLIFLDFRCGVCLRLVRFMRSPWYD